MENINKKQYNHICHSCNILHCVFCRIKLDAHQYTIHNLYSILNQQFSKKWINFSQFTSYYHQIYFKLTKYTIYWPNIINKTCNISNIIIEINKKTLAYQNNTQPSYLAYCIQRDYIGKKINLIVKDKYYNPKINIVYIYLSDGWSSIWAAISSTNLLFSYILNQSKVMVGTKLAISCWNLHPISNILQFCEKSQSKEQKCIQFYYNGCIILQSNSRLGFQNKQFYRPLNKCRSKGGLIPVAQGIIIRLFTIKNTSKKIKFQQTNLINHYAQILTPEGFTCLIKFILNQQSSLVQYFRLFHSYRFYKLKINQENQLTFLMNQSKFDQIKIYKISQKDQIYPETVLQLLRKRLINCQPSSWKQGIYDVFCKENKVITKQNIEYSLEMEGEVISNSVYQQVLVIKLDKNRIKIQRQRQSSQLRKIPKIYQKIISQ